MARALYSASMRNKAPNGVKHIWAKSKRVKLVLRVFNKVQSKEHCLGKKFAAHDSHKQPSNRFTTTSSNHQNVIGHRSDLLINVLGVRVSSM